MVSDARQAGVLAASVVALGQALNAAAAYAATLAIRDADPYAGSGMRPAAMLLTGLAAGAGALRLWRASHGGRPWTRAPLPIAAAYALTVPVALPGLPLPRLWAPLDSALALATLASVGVWEAASYVGLPWVFVVSWRRTARRGALVLAMAVAAAATMACAVVVGAFSNVDAIPMVMWPSVFGVAAVFPLMMRLSVRRAQG